LPTQIVPDRLCLPIVVTKRLLVEVAEQMKRLDTHIGSVNSAFLKAPVVLKAIGVNFPVYVGHGMVDNLMLELVEPVLGLQGVGVQGGTSLDMLADRCLNLGLFPALDDHRPHFAAALKYSHDGSLILDSSSGDFASPNVLVHVASFTADEGLVGLDLAASHARFITMHRHANSVHHEPRRLLSNPKGASDLTGANTVLAVAEHPERAHPLIQTQGRILEYSSDLEGELLLASRAKPNAAGPDERVLFRSTARADNHTVRPPKVKRVLKASVWIAEVNDRVLQCLWRFHVIVMRLFALCVKYIITQI